jgi:glycosyltransferase involved in cell wall biosynthesis
MNLPGPARSRSSAQDAAQPVAATRVGTKRLVLVTDHFTPDEGGAERQMRQVTAELTRRGWDVVVLTRWRAGLPRHERFAQVRVLRLGRGALGPRGAAMFLAATVAQLVPLRPDVVISLQLGAAGFGGWIGAELCRAPYVLRLTGGEAAGRLEVCSASRRLRLPRRMLLASADAVVAPAAHLLGSAGAFADLVRSKGSVIPNGVQAAAEATVKARKRETVMWAGRPRPIKGFPDFVELARRCPRLEFVALGPEEGDAPGAPPNLQCLGWVERPEEHYRRAAVMVSTSRFEGSPNAVFEALAGGVPVVGYDNAGLREVAESAGDAVILVPTGDVERLTDSVLRRLHNRRPVTVEVPSIRGVTEQWDRFLTTLASTADREATRR